MHMGERAISVTPGGPDCLDEPNDVKVTFEYTAIDTR
jgi:hypothetical protein